MHAKISIYLAGSTKKGHETAGKSFWTDEDLLSLKENLSEYELSFLNPAFRLDDLSDQRSVFGRDMTQVFCSDVVFVNARGRLGLGVGAEMMWAKFHKIPIITLAPKDSHYNKTGTTLLGVAVENWIHPFVDSLSDAVVENILDGAAWVKKFASALPLRVKGLESIYSAMEHYRDRQLPHDEPMKALILANQKLHKRIWEPKDEEKATVYHRS